jgi:hypothetical protein
LENGTASRTAGAPVLVGFAEKEVTAVPNEVEDIEEAVGKIEHGE